MRVSPFAFFPVGFNIRGAVKEMLVAIGGVSRGGKTQLADSMRLHLLECRRRVCVLHQDDFVVEEGEMPRMERERHFP